jgi:hypothetical protein
LLGVEGALDRYGRRGTRKTLDAVDRRPVRSQLVARGDVAILAIDEHDKINPW